jgi:hypothetical protein
MTAAATAHETTAAGGYDLVVGWGTEPAYVGQQNSVQIEISERGSGRPFVKLGDSLRVTIIYGDQKKEMALTPEFDLGENVGTPGDYRAWFFPTAPGDYTFRFTGKIGSQRIDKSFTSSPTTFSPVEDPASAQFPVKVPSNAELAQRVDAEMPRLERVAAELPRLATDSDMSSARTFGIVGIVIGVLGLVVAAFALLRRRA